MKILVINSINLRETIHGGVMVSDRNIKGIKDLFGENVIVYNIPYYSSRSIAFLYSLKGYIAGITPNIIEKIKKTISLEQVDCIFFNTSRFGKIIRILSDSNIYTITFFHNVEKIFHDSFLKHISIIKKLLYQPMKLLIILSEKYITKYSNKIIMINNRDASNLREIYGRNADFILPITFEDRYDENRARYYDSEIQEKKLLFVGSNFFGNTEGLFWFIENCLDEINAELLVIGNGMDTYKDNFPNKKIIFTGYVDNLADYYYQANAVVLPILSGTGMKTKTCEALMYGKTIFGTQEAFEGYDALDLVNNNWLCNTKEEFILKINNYLEENNSKASRYAREIYSKNYSTDIARNILLSVFNN